MSDNFALYFMVSGFLKAVLPIAVIILGIVILAKKDGRAKPLALYCILISFIDLLSRFANGMSRVSVQSYSAATRVNTYLGAALTLAALILICRYAKKEYDSKEYIAIPCAYVAAMVIGSFINVIALNAAAGKGENAILRSAGIASAVSILIQLIPALILIGIFFANKKKEWQFPNLWLLLAAVAASSLICNIFTVLGLVSLSQMQTADNISLYQDAMSILIIICKLLIAIYILKNVKGGTDERVSSESNS